MIQIRTNCLFYLFLFILLSSCDNIYIVTSKYPDGKPKVVRLSYDSHSKTSCYKRLYPSGIIEKTFCLNNQKLTGVSKEYSESGKLLLIMYYEDDLEHGGQVDYTEEEPYYWYYHRGELVYSKSLIKKNGENELFFPSLLFHSDSIKLNDSLSFSFSLPLPDSIANDRNFQFIYGLKNENLVDSIILDLGLISKIDSNLRSGKLLLDETEDVIFAYYIYDPKEKHVFAPTEIEIKYSSKDKIHLLPND